MTVKYRSFVQVAPHLRKHILQLAYFLMHRGAPAVLNLRVILVASLAGGLVLVLWFLARFLGRKRLWHVKIFTTLWSLGSNWAPVRWHLEGGCSPFSVLVRQRILGWLGVDSSARGQRRLYVMHGDVSLVLIFVREVLVHWGASQVAHRRGCSATLVLVGLVLNVLSQSTNLSLQNLLLLTQRFVRLL
jgi:hypothetical protein